MKFNYKKTLPHVAFIGAAILLIVGLFALVQSEEAKTRDTVRMQEVIGIKQGLYRYYLNRVAYPPAERSMPLGVSDSDCLNDKGFVSHFSAECARRRPYLVPVPSAPGRAEEDIYMYTPFAEDGTTLCNSTIGCPRYEIRFYLETDVFAPKGVHVLTAEGME